jgi:hypothetical protein
MNQSNLNINDLVYLVLDNQATDIERKILFDALKDNNELQNEFHDAMILKKESSKILSAYTPPLALTNQLFEKANLDYISSDRQSHSQSESQTDLQSTKHEINSNKKPFWKIVNSRLSLMLISGIVCGLIGYYLHDNLNNNLYYNANNSLTNNPSQSNYTSEMENNQSANKSNLQYIPQISNRENLNTNSLSQIDNSSAKISRKENKQSKKYTELNVKSIKSNHQYSKANQIENLDKKGLESSYNSNELSKSENSNNANFASNIELTKSKNTNNLDLEFENPKNTINKNDLQVNPEKVNLPVTNSLTNPISNTLSNPLQSENPNIFDLNAKNNLTMTTMNNLFFELSTFSSLLYFPSRDIVSDDKIELNNIALALYYQMSDNSYLGLSIGQESMPIYFIENSELKPVKSMIWFGANYRYNFVDLEIVKDLKPYFDLFAGGTITGPLAKTQLGLNYRLIDNPISKNSLEIFTSLDASMLLYQNKGIYKQSSKIGLRLGANFAF